MRAHRKQVAGLIISPDWVADPSLANPYIKEIAAHQYLAFVVFIRHQKRCVLDPEVRDAVAKVVAVAHRHNLKVLLDTDPTFWGPNVAERSPEAALHVIRSVETTAHDGRFSFIAPLTGAYGFEQFAAVLSVFRPEAGGGFRRINPRDIAFEWMNGNAGIIIEGTVKGGYSGPLVFYVDLKTFGLADQAHPVYLKAQKELLNLYRGIPLDGFGWDEPGKGVSMGVGYKAGDGFRALFERTNGYPLAENLIWLDHGDGTLRAVKVRCDFFRTLSEMNYQAQKQHNDYARKLFGKDLMFGTHQTWSGIPADLAGGVMDYFKLGRVLTASWTDGSWDCSQFKYQAYYFTLAEGVKRELGFRDAYYNDWGSRVPAIENMRLANRFKMLFHVNWFNIFFSDSSESLLNFRLEPLRSFARQEVESLDRFDQFIGDRFSPHSDVAVLYSWESVAALPRWVVRPFYMTFANMSLELADSGLFGPQISGQGVLQARPEKDGFKVGAHRYRVLVVPYGSVLPGEVYRKIMALCAAGVPVVFFGPPPEHEAETGRSIVGEFAKSVGMKPFSFAQYKAAYAECNPVPRPDQWEPSWVDFAYPVSVTDGVVSHDREGRIIAVRSARLPLWYLPAADPRQDLVNVLRPLTAPPADVFAEGTYHRFFTDPADSRSLIVVAVAKGHTAAMDLLPAEYGPGRAPIQDRSLKALFRFPGGDLTVRGGTWVAARIQGGRLTDYVGDCPKVSWARNRQ